MQIHVSIAFCPLRALLSDIVLSHSLCYQTDDQSYHLHLLCCVELLQRGHRTD